ncbi:hypothetical protein [Limimaricola hongkongensis]|uniref:hypothetical protein n=1 Tax=Limimaricola hongkongensis TaxID=278132 RepID=UPI000369E727|nr:hypothetical protein [Limimaricola hongkongensis]
MTEPLRYGRAKLSTTLADFDVLRAAIKSHDSFAAESAWDRCERWLGLIQTATPPLHSDTERRALAAEAEILRLRARLDEAQAAHDETLCCRYRPWPVDRAVRCPASRRRLARV